MSAKRDEYNNNNAIYLGWMTGQGLNVMQHRSHLVWIYLLVLIDILFTCINAANTSNVDLEQRDARQKAIIANNKHGWRHPTCSFPLTFPKRAVNDLNDWWNERVTKSLKLYLEWRFQMTYSILNRRNNLK